MEIQRLVIGDNSEGYVLQKYGNREQKTLENAERPERKQYDKGFNGETMSKEAIIWAI